MASAYADKQILKTDLAKVKQDNQILQKQVAYLLREKQRLENSVWNIQVWKKKIGKN